MHVACRARCIIADTETVVRIARIAMIARTTNNSTKVNADGRAGEFSGEKRMIRADLAKLV